MASVAFGVASCGIAPVAPLWHATGKAPKTLVSSAISTCRPPCRVLCRAESPLFDGAVQRLAVAANQFGRLRNADLRHFMVFSCRAMEAISRITRFDSATSKIDSAQAGQKSPVTA